MKVKILLIFLACIFSANAQSPPVTLQEVMVAHVNTTFFLAGETLRFQLYCLDKNSRSPSSVSKIGYVELVDSNSKPLARIKVRLNDGIGNGDFFFNENFPSGNYTFVAYTRWMNNFGEENIFRVPLTVINPQLRPAVGGQAPQEVFAQPSADLNAGKHGSISINKRQFSFRELVDVELGNSDSVALITSVSVRAADPELTAVDPWRDILRRPSLSTPLEQINSVPDFRSELITGIIRQKSDGQPLAGKLVTLSSPSQEYGFVVSTTDKNGRYYFNLPQADATLLLLGVDGYTLDDLTIGHDDGFLTDYSSFTSKALELDTSYRSLIARRYLPMQVENAFYGVKRDSIMPTQGAGKFFSHAEKRYQLDDFTRFPSMDDVFREIVPEVVVRSREGNYSLTLVNSATGFRFENQPLILVDGIPVYDANTIMKYDPALIKAIDLVTQRYYYGGLQANGIISIETYDGDAKSLPVENFFRIDHVAPLPTKVHYSPRYDRDQSLQRIPDFRTQLYWNAAVRIEAGSKKRLSFFTGDLTGSYVVEVVGVNSQGELIWWRDKFEVKE